VSKKLKKKQKLIMALIKKHQSLTQAEIVTLSNLPQSTVSRILQKKVADRNIEGFIETGRIRYKILQGRSP